MHAGTVATHGLCSHGLHQFYMLRALDSLYKLKVMVGDMPGIRQAHVQLNQCTADLQL